MKTMIAFASKTGTTENVPGNSPVILMMLNWWI